MCRVRWHTFTRRARAEHCRGGAEGRCCGKRERGASGVSQKGQKMCIDGESEPQNRRASVGAHHGQSSALRGRPLRSVKAGVGPRRGPQLGAILRRRKWQSRASLTRASAAPLLHPTRCKRVVPGCWVRRAAARGQRRAGRGTPNMEEERARPSGPSRAACIRHGRVRGSVRVRVGHEKHWRPGAPPQGRHCARAAAAQAPTAPATSGGRAPWRSCGSAGWSAPRATVQHAARAKPLYSLIRWLGVAVGITV
jgi:hypothetical protein